jgi:HSP20 family molecular chaperone IbpA
MQAFEGLTPVYSEYRVGNFLRRFNVPRSYAYDPEKISAKLHEGTLEVHIPKAERAKPRRVQVAAG